jgi:hypothetical protein
MLKRNQTMNRLTTATLFAALAAGTLAGAAHAQSTTSDPLGINATDDPTTARLNGQLQGGTNSALGILPDSYRSEDTVSSWSLENGDIIFHKKGDQK